MDAPFTAGHAGSVRAVRYGVPKPRLPGPRLPASLASHDHIHHTNQQQPTTNQRPTNNSFVVFVKRSKRYFHLCNLNIVLLELEFHERFVRRDGILWLIVLYFALQENGFRFV